MTHPCDAHSEPGAALQLKSNPKTARPSHVSSADPTTLAPTKLMGIAFSGANLGGMEAYDLALHSSALGRSAELNSIAEPAPSSDPGFHAAYGLEKGVDAHQLSSSPALDGYMSGYVQLFPSI